MKPGIIGATLLLLGCPSGDPEPGEPTPTPAPTELVAGDPIEFLDISAPVIEVEDVERIGDIVWACSNSDGLVSVDVSDPSNLQVLTQWNLASPRCDHLSIDGDRLYTASHPLTDDGEGWMATVDSSDPGSPQVLDQIWADYDPEGLTVHDGELLIATVTDGLIAAATSPGWPERGRVETARAMQVRAAGDIAWVADGEEGLIAVEISSLSRLGVLPLDGNPADLDLLDGRAVVALGGAGVALVDTSDPSAPRLLDQYDTPGSALGVSASGDLVWVADWLDLRLLRIDGDSLVDVGRQGMPLETVPPPVDPNLPNFSLGVVAWDDLALSSNWTEFASLRAHPDRSTGDLVVEPRLLRLPRTPLGETSSAAFRLRNDGHRPITVTSLTLEAGFSSDEPLPLVLEPGTQEGVTLSYFAGVDDPREATLVVESDDLDEPTQRVSVLVNGQGLDVGDPVPDLTFLGLDGAPVRLEDRLDGPVLLAYFATF
jgi:hypothetical protein